MQLLSSNQHVAIPNVALAETRIQNFSRMEARRGMIDFHVVASTPVRTQRSHTQCPQIPAVPSDRSAH